jgi:hypothetical protein
LSKEEEEEEAIFLQREREASQLFSFASIFFLPFCRRAAESIGSRSCNIPSAFMIACRDQSFVSNRHTFSSSSSSSFPFWD